MGTSITVADWTADYAIPNESGARHMTRNPDVVFSTPLDLGDATAMRLDVNITDAGIEPGLAPHSIDLRLALEHGPTADGPFVELVPTRRYTSQTDGGTRIVVGNCDRFVRAKRTVMQGRWKLSITGDALPA